MKPDRYAFRYAKYLWFYACLSMKDDTLPSVCSIAFSTLRQVPTASAPWYRHKGPVASSLVQRVANHAMALLAPVPGDSEGPVCCRSQKQVRRCLYQVHQGY